MSKEPPEIANAATEPDAARTTNEIPDAVSEGLNNLKPGLDYIYTPFLPPNTPDQIPQLEFLKACERLDIPSADWPKFEIKLLRSAMTPDGKMSAQPRSGFVISALCEIKLRQYDLLSDTPEIWTKYARAACDEAVEAYLKYCTRRQKYFAVPRKSLRAGKDLIPLEQRYEFAALHYCRGMRWKQLSEAYSGIFTPDRIRKAVAGVLHSVGLKYGNKR